MKINKNNNSKITLIGILLLLCIIGVIGIFLFRVYYAEEIRHAGSSIIANFFGVTESTAYSINICLGLILFLGWIIYRLKHAWKKKYK